MRNQTKLHLQQLQLAMQKLDLWQEIGRASCRERV